MTLGPTIIEGAYLRDLLEQPEALRNACAGLEDDSRFGPLARGLDEGKYRRVVLTGMGSSLYALNPLHLALSDHGFISQMVETSELVHYMERLLEPRTLLIAVSQSGRSAEILRLLDLAAGRTVIVGVTNDERSPLALKSDVVLPMRAGAEFTVSCKTYVTSLLVLEWLGANLCGCDLQQAGAELRQAAPAAAAYLANWRSHVASLTDLTRGVRQLFVSGRGASLAAARTGGLILKESARFAAEAMSCAAFRHGPFEMLDAGVLVLVFAGDERTAMLNRKLADDVRAAGGRAAVVEQDAPEEVFRLPAVPGSVRPIVEILPLQMLSLALAAANGHEAGRFELASKVTSVE